VSTAPRTPTQLRRFRRRTVRLRVEYVANGALRSEWATTLGAGGMFVETEGALAVGTRLVLRFRVPGGAITHEREGRVAWSMPAGAAARSPAPSPGMGIEFVDTAATAALAHELEREPHAAS